MLEEPVSHVPHKTNLVCTYVLIVLHALMFSTHPRLCFAVQRQLHKVEATLKVCISGGGRGGGADYLDAFPLPIMPHMPA